MKSFYIASWFMKVFLLLFLFLIGNFGQNTNREGRCQKNDMLHYKLKHDLFCSLKLECEKLASEKTEMQRHYVMVSIFVFIFISVNIS